MIRTVIRRLRGTRLIFVLAAMSVLAAWIACSNDTTPYAPLGTDKPKSGDVVAGSVHDPGQTAVKGAIVSIEALSDGIPATALALKDHPELAGKLDSPAAAASDVTRRVTVTDARGRFYFDGMAPGDYAVQVRADNHLGAIENLAIPNTPQALDTIIVNVNLTPTGTFSGIATLENTTVHSDIVVYIPNTSYVGVTASNGAYSLTDVPVAGYTIRATKSHYLDDSKIGTLTFAGQNLGLPAMLLKIDNNIAPVATITIPVQPMVANVAISFQAAGTDLDGSVVLYEWDWENDGTMDASSASPGSTNHTYATPGNYTVKLRVTDNLGAIGLDAKVITIASDAVYMATTGVDTNSGSQASPVFTLAKAYQIAQINGITKVRAGQGVYTEVPLFANGIDVVGGYDALWNPDAGYTTFNVGTSRAKATGITAATTIHRVQIQAAGAPAGANSVALLSQGCTLALVFDNCTFKASNAGSSGTAGGAGGAGIGGGNGNPGGPGDCDTNGPGGAGGGGGPSSVCVGGPGGKGGANGTNPGTAGSNGACAGGAGGPGGPGGDPGSPGLNGNPGPNGTYGALGTSSAPNGSIVGNDWQPGNGGNGTGGTDGKGGGGGGGGGGQGCTLCNDGPGNGGGGGGGAATAGGGGNGGASGFGSIAVLLIASSPTFQSCTIVTANGSAGQNGGAGGDGGLGGGGGLGGTVCAPSEVGKGGNGGKGGDGGGGGGGAGGAGGPSIGIIKASGSVPTLNAIIYNLGLSGTPGNGGLTGKLSGVNGPSAPNGPGGIQAQTLNL